MTKDTDQEALHREINAKAAFAAKNLLLVKGLYDGIEINDDMGRLVEAKLRAASVGTFDCYCIGCKKETPFIISAMPVVHSGGGLRGGNALAQPPSVFAVRSVCQRDLKTYIYVFEKSKDRLTKIGQTPSVADISFGELNGIEGTLDSLDRKELGKAIGLFAHDAASGAFVYLRRVFERMIRRAHDRRIEGGTAAIEDFDRMRVDEKIKALSAELPDRVVKNSAVFSVLSAGIHELADEECLTLFPVLKAVIFQMLEEEEHKRRKKIVERETDAAFQALLSKSSNTAARELPATKSPGSKEGACREGR